jgi:hypothetical protein
MKFFKNKIKKNNKKKEEKKVGILFFFFFTSRDTFTVVAIDSKKVTPF